jgi:transposase
MYIPEDKSYTITASSGAVNQTVSAVKGKKLVRVYVNSATGTTTYSLKITEHTNAIPWIVTGLKGKYVEKMDDFITGNFTFGIYDASRDEAFTVILTFVEEGY